tara:strand:- start:292 stop:789 length:498 start_codon:yes stop_codon:yes gene_type:complete
MQLHPFDYLDLKNGGRFIFTPCPGTKNTSVSEALETLNEAGAKTIITVLSSDEIEALSVSSLGKDTTDKNLKWYQLPIEDDCEPAEAFNKTWEFAKDKILTLLEHKETVAIHCRGGSGRTGLMAAILLLETGENWEDVKQQIQSIRPKALTHPAHINYLKKHYSI